MIKPEIKFIAIVGPTASGKTEMALQLAEDYGGEIICADSRTIYRGMDIGTAKPSKIERSRVPHHLLDIVDPGERLSAAGFKALADHVISDIWKRKKVPFLVGGSGLYVDAVLYDYQFWPEADQLKRRELERMTNDELLCKLFHIDQGKYENIDRANRRRIIRAIETAGSTNSRRATVLPGALVLGVQVNKEIAQSRIETRTIKMLEEGLISEVKQLGTKFGRESEALNIMGYRELREVVWGTKSLDMATRDIIASHVGLYKKQMTWFKRNQQIKWVHDREEAAILVRDFLDKEKRII